MNNLNTVVLNKSSVIIFQRITLDYITIIWCKKKFKRKTGKKERKSRRNWLQKHRNSFTKKSL